MQIVRVLLFGCVLLAGCNGAPSDAFDSAKSNEMLANPERFSAEEIYRAYKAAMERPPPPITSLATPLGVYGKESVLIWLADLQEGGSVSSSWEFGPILREAYYQGGYFVCADEAVYQEIISTLTEVHEFRDQSYAVSMLNTSCSVAAGSE